MGQFFQLVHAKNVTLEEPTVIKYYEGDSTTPKFATLKKEALKFIYDVSLKIGVSVSSKIYDISPDIWRDVVNLRMSQNTEFNLDNFVYVMHNSFVFSLTELDVKENVEAFDALHTTLKGYSTLSAYNTLQIIWQSPIDDVDDYVPIMMFDISFDDGKYKVYTGVLRDDRYIILSAPAVDEASFELFISKNFSYEMEMTKKLADSINSRYVYSKAKDIRLSVREVVEFLKKTKIKVNCDDDGLVESFDGLNDCDSLLSFFDTFNMTYKSLTKLPLLRKSVKSDGLVLDELFRIMCGDCFTFNNNIKAETIADILRIYYTEESDIMIMNDIINRAGN